MTYWKSQALVTEVLFKNWAEKGRLVVVCLCVNGVVRIGSDYTHPPTHHYENDDRNEQIRFWLSCSTLLSTSVGGTDTCKI